ncbi:MAG TPA: OsmC family protein [Paenirhodobacter sp.]
MIVKSGSAHWQGPIRTGKGKISTQSGALSDQPYGFNTRFEDKPGTNPEELIAAAHAACFSMALSGGLEQAGITDVTIDTQAKVSMDKDAGGFTIKSSILQVTVSGTRDHEAIRKAAEAAKAGCPVSRVLSCEVGMTLTIA